MSPGLNYKGGVPASSGPHGVHDQPEVQAAMRSAIAASRKQPAREHECTHGLSIIPDWQPCAGGCGYPLDPVIVAEGHTMHQGCAMGPMTPRQQRIAAAKSRGKRR